MLSSVMCRRLLMYSHWSLKLNSGRLVPRVVWTLLWLCREGIDHVAIRAAWAVYRPSILLLQLVCCLLVCTHVFGCWLRWSYWLGVYGLAGAPSNYIVATGCFLACIPCFACCTTVSASAVWHVSLHILGLLPPLCLWSDIFTYRVCSGSYWPVT